MTPAEQDAAVLAVLRAAPEPLTAAEIARQISTDGRPVYADQVLRSCVRLKAVREHDRFGAPRD